MALTPPTLASETLFHIGNFGVRNTLVMAWMAMVLLLTVAGIGRIRGYRLVPGRFQALLELIVESMFGLFDSIIQDRSFTKKIFPMMATFFLFILVGNWLGIIPGVNSITIQGIHNGHEATIPLFRSMNADVNMTLAFTLISVIATQVIGIASLGILGHIGKYIVPPWKKPYGIGTAVGILEFVGEFARLVSFVFRLFGNIFAGEVLLVVISFLVPYLLPIPFLGLEVFVGLIQALVFSLLTVAFIKMSVVSHGDHPEHASAPAHA